MKKVVCFGDSITEGFGLQEDEAYPFVLAELLGEEYQVINEGVTAHCVTNECLEDGRTICLPYAKTERYADGIAQAGDIYVILLGTNDAQDGLWDNGEGVDPTGNVIAYVDRFNYHYQCILDDIKKANPKAEIFIGYPVPVLNCIWPKHQQKYLDIILMHLRRIAADNPGVKTIDLFGEFSRQGRAWLEENYQADGLHPAKNGARRIAEIVCGAITKGE